MFKMEIQMDEEKILREDKINLLKVYAALDKICSEHGLKKEGKADDGTITYTTNDKRKGFGAMVAASIQLDRQYWFVPNCKKHLWSDDEDNPGVWETEDLLDNALRRKGLK